MKIHKHNILFAVGIASCAPFYVPWLKTKDNIMNLHEYGLKIRTFSSNNRLWSHWYTYIYIYIYIFFFYLLTKVYFSCITLADFSFLFRLSVFFPYSMYWLLWNVISFDWGRINIMHNRNMIIAYCFYVGQERSVDATICMKLLSQLFLFCDDTKT